MAERLGRQYEMQICNLYVNGLTQQEAANKVSVDVATVQRVLRRYGIATIRGGRGAANNRWAGGKRHGKYVEVWIAEDHRFACMRRPNGSVTEHRLVMAEHLGRPLLSTETVHHINGDRYDNRLDNLQLRQGNHGPGVVMRCIKCGSLELEPVNV